MTTDYDLFLTDFTIICVPRFIAGLYSSLKSRFGTRPQIYLSLGHVFIARPLVSSSRHYLFSPGRTDIITQSHARATKYVSLRTIASLYRDVTIYN